MPDTEIRYSYKHAPTLLAFSNSDAFIRGLMGPVGGGKSAACVVEIISRAHAQAPGRDGIRRTRWAVIRNTFGELRDTTIKTFHDWVPPGLFGNWHASNHEYTITGFPGLHIEVIFRALDRPDHVKKLLSLELTGAWGNEARELAWPVIEVLQTRVGRYPSMRDGGPTWAGIILDTNPPDVDSEWYKFFEDTDHSEAVEALSQRIPGMTLDRYMRIFKQPSGLGPMAENLPNLTAGYYQRNAIGKSAEWVKVYLKGEYGYVQEGKPVFPEFSDTLHMGNAKTLINLPVYRGWDFGLTPACVFSQVTPSGQWCVVDEMVSESMGIDRFSDRVLEHSAKEFPKREFIDIGDPAGQQRAQTDERTCFQIMHAKGIDIQPAPQSETIRLESMRKALNSLADGKPRFVLHPRCQVLRKGFLGGYAYRRRKVSGESYDPHPEKNRFSHVMDGTTYTAAWIFGGGLTTPREQPDEDEYAFGGYADRNTVTGY